MPMRPAFQTGRAALTIFFTDNAAHYAVSEGFEMPNPMTPSILGWARKLRYPTLFKITAGLFVLSLLIPDPLPFVDEILFGLSTLLLANWKNRKDEPRIHSQGQGHVIEGDPPSRIK